MSEELISKNTLKPLVENAIKQGLKESKKIPGHQAIRIERENRKTIKICISDDGIGMKESPQFILNTGAVQGKNGHGYGIHNVSSRLTLLYGPDYGLSFEKNMPEGTIAIVRLPVPEESAL